jgi:fructose-bisphosphate aldolase class I
MSIEDLESIALAMVAPGKGIIAIDESTKTIGKRLAAVGVESTEETRRAYREMLLTTPGLGEHISGAILYDETIRQSTKDGVPFTTVMKKAGIIPGIKVDKGTVPLAGFPGDVVTEGLDGLRERLQEYAKLGAQFAKWRAVIMITEDTPSSTAIEANCHALARYAALCQEAGLVPIRLRQPFQRPSAARPLSRARAWTIFCAPAVFAFGSFAHSVSAACCMARPYENDSGHGCGPM